MSTSLRSIQKYIPWADAGFFIRGTKPIEGTFVTAHISAGFTRFDRLGQAIEKPPPPKGVVIIYGKGAVGF